MKRTLITVVILLLLIPIGKACDGCGSSISGGGVGLLTQANARFLGLNYRYSLFNIGQLSSTTLNQDQFSDIQLLARVGLTKRLIVQGVLPYRLINRTGPETIPVDEKGIGDISILANWSFIDQMTEKGHRIFWSAGAGVIIPSGKYVGIYDDRTPDYLYPGTGAWGTLLQSNFSLHFANWGINTSASALFRQENKANYRFGNQWTQSLLAFWKKGWPKFSVAPFAGVYSEILDNGRRNGSLEDPSSAGYGTFGNLGVEAGFRRMNLTMQTKVPMIQNYSAGEASAQTRFSVALAILL